MPPTNNTPNQEPTPHMSHHSHHLLAYILSLVAIMLAVFAVASVSSAGTIVPGQQKQIDRNARGIDTDNNGIPDVGVTVNGKYVSVYAYDNAGDWYWDLGDGRINGTVSSIDLLDAETLTTCDYQVQYRGNFENTPFLDSGWIMNNINCSGYDDDGNYNYLIVHETDPRYRGNPDWSIWGTWEYHVLTESGKGNLVRPMKATGI